jgi:hypothetical protein
MNTMKKIRWIQTIALCLLLAASAFAQSPHEVTVAGTTFRLNGKHFSWTGISFFNAIYNPTFNQSSEERLKWLRKFHQYGINVLRLWGQWDAGRGYVDSCSDCSLYHPNGNLRAQHVARLKEITADADKLGIVIELALFAQESWKANVKLGPAEADRAVAALTKEMLPHRNITFQIWNEFSERVLDHVKTIKTIDPKRLVSNSPSVFDNPSITNSFGEDKNNKALDYLTPHTVRQSATNRHWEVAPKEIEYLITRYKKPVVDDEPARNGTPNFGGPKVPTDPYDHILQIYQVWQAGGYILYHHDMFQTGYNTPAVPPSGIPDPEFNPYHKTVLDFIAKRERYQPTRQ